MDTLAQKLKSISDSVITDNTAAMNAYSKIYNDAYKAAMEGLTFVIYHEDSMSYAAKRLLHEKLVDCGFRLTGEGNTLKVEG